MAHQILEANRGASGLVLLGIPTRGVVLAHRLAEAMDDGRGRRRFPTGSLDVTMYRDDLRRHPTRAVGHTQVPVEVDDARRGAGRRRACTPGAPYGPRWTPSVISVDRAPSGWPCWSTAGTGSCPSAPITSARTCRPRPASGSASGWPRSTA